MVVLDEHLPIGHPADTVAQVEFSLFGLQIISIPFNLDIALEIQPLGGLVIFGVIGLKRVVSLYKKNIPSGLGDLTPVEGLDRVGIEIPGDIFRGSGRSSSILGKANKKEKKDEKKWARRDM
jgi:hypothetical protein